jgi:two-component system phosphate regulon sensor histidine kinase PhoR
MNRIFRKIAIRISLLFLAVVSAASLFSVLYLDNAYKNDVKEDLFRHARTIEKILLIEDFHTGSLYEIDEIQNMRITLMDYDGTVIFDSRTDTANLENHANRPEVIEALEYGSGSNIRRSGTLGADMMYVALRSDKLELVVRVSLMLEGVAAYSSAFWIPLLTMLLVTFLLCLGISLFVSRGFTRHIINLKNDTVKIAEGRYDELKQLNTGDEIETLSGALCDMADKLRRNFEAINENNSRMEAVFRAVPGGIIAVDNTMKVIMANPVARSMFSMDNKPEGRHFLEVTRHKGLESVIREAASSANVVEREMNIARSMEMLYLQVFAASVSGEGQNYGVILLVQDITHLRKLENLRREFVANVTHELKTPLTVIRGFVDTLKDPTMPYTDITRFLDIIALESERLTRLINDVLLLSEIENIAEKPAEAVDLREGVREATLLLEKAACKKGIAYHVDIADEEIFVAADTDRIKQMGINLIDNAIKYTMHGGSVNISVYNEGNDAVFSVEDTGIGIPEDNLPRLFERFYRVDTSRSRALGGTGLGLAIVKHIVSLFGGYIAVSSHLNEGSTFTVYLPLLRDRA